MLLQSALFRYMYLSILRTVRTYKIDNLIGGLPAYNATLGNSQNCHSKRVLVYPMISVKGDSILYPNTITQTSIPVSGQACIGYHATYTYSKRRHLFRKTLHLLHGVASYWS